MSTVTGWSSVSIAFIASLKRYFMKVSVDSSATIVAVVLIKLAANSL